MAELTGLIRAKSSPDKHEVQDSANFVSFFPDFVWTLRDFSLQLEADGQPITADEYLENSLKLKQGYWDSWLANKKKRKQYQNDHFNVDDENYNFITLLSRLFY